MTGGVVLLSGGLDSTTCLALAVEDQGSSNIHAVNILYGQRHQKELECAQKIADYYGVQYTLIDLSKVFEKSDCSLLSHSSKKIVHKSYADQLNDLGGRGVVSTYVPFRNGLMLSTAVSFALTVDADVVYYGAHADDAAGGAYPDCTPEFVKAMNNAALEGTDQKVSILAPFINSFKKDIVECGLSLGVPYELTWSCYEGGDKPCGKCGTCIDRMNAFEQNHAVDPLLK